MFSINPSLYVGLRNPKKHIKTPENAKQHNIYARPRLAPAAEGTAPVACRHAPGASRWPPKALMRARQSSLLLAEPSPGHTSFLQQHHFQGNIQQIIN
ncbi:hypothetical protein QL285_069820 [Trifolium repens]|jgi:hypothetical protein|nr:hypothetical protein QL285_069820 [Trifolium repens]